MKEKKIKVKLFYVMNLVSYLCKLSDEIEEESVLLFKENKKLDETGIYEANLIRDIAEYNYDKNTEKLQVVNPVAVNYIKMLKLSDKSKELSENIIKLNAFLNSNSIFIFANKIVEEMMKDKINKSNQVGFFVESYFDLIESEVEFSENLFLKFLESQKY